MPDLHEAALLFSENRLRPQPISPLEPSIRPQTMDQAYAIQPLLHERLKLAGLGDRVGYKIGCTTPVMQEFLGIRHPCAGGVMAETMYRHDAELQLSDYAGVGIECEIAVVLGSDIRCGDGPHTRDSVAGYIDTCMVAAEIVDNRYEDFHAMGTPSLIADDFFGAGCVLGDPVTAWRSLDLQNIAGRTLLNGAEVGSGTGADVLGHPLEAVAWLVNMKEEAGETLKAGEIILTGSLVETLWPENTGDKVAVAIEGMGTLTINCY